MNKRLLELLNAKFLGKGVRKDGLEQLASSLSMTVTTDEEAQALVDRLSDEQVTEFVKDWRKTVDSEVNKGVETFRKKKTDDPAPENPAPAGGEPTNPADIATIVQNAVKAAVEPFQQKLAQYDQQTIAEKRQSAYAEVLANAPEAFKEKALRDYGRMNFKDEEDFSAFLSETKTDLDAYTQAVADQANSGYRRPYAGAGAGSKDQEPSAGVKDYLASQQGKGGEGDLGGKSI